jgi:magnesium chelatase family protein
MKKILSASIESQDIISVNVEASFTKGMPSFTIVGIVSTSINESKDRVKSALLLNEYKFPPLKIIINLSPSEVKKKGAHFDLAIALLIALYDKKVSFEDFYIFGELGLDGKVKDTDWIFPIVLSLAKQKQIKNVLVCKDSAKKLSKIPNINIYSVDDLSSAIDFFKFDNKQDFKYENSIFEFNKLNINSEDYYYIQDYKEDFKDVKGQELAKFAALISAAGAHNLLIEGSPGCGKSMISKRIRYIMPPMSLDELLDKAKLQSFDNQEVDFIPHRNFRSPHNSSSKPSIFGGGSSIAKVGEVALSNNGILFFDELPHFSKTVLESLREPLEDNKIHISRVNSKTIYDAKFTFVSAMNPCPCGNLLPKVKECRCNELEIKKYKNRLSEPFLDRIDLFVSMNDSFDDNENKVSSKELHENVLDVFEIQKLRGQKELNGKLSDLDIKVFCLLDDEAEEILEKARLNYSLTHRSLNKALKVARTIADLNKNIKISKDDLLKSLNFRKR